MRLQIKFFSLQDYFRKEGIKFQCTAGYAPEQNGIAERKNRTIMEAARTMLIDAQLPKFLWSEAVNEANFNLNRVLSKSRNLLTPVEIFMSKKHKLCQDFSINIQNPVQIQADNQSAIKIISNNKFSNSTKHIDTKYHFIKDIKEKGIIDVTYCPGERNLADKLTNALGPSKLRELRMKFNC